MLSPESRLTEFPSLEGMTYLNTAAESIPPLSVRDALADYWEHKTMGMKGRDYHFPVFEKCRERTAAFFEFAPEELSFCSCTSEAYNLLASALDLQSEDEVVVSDLDFPAGVTPWLRIAAEPGIRLWENRSGILELDDLDQLLNENTKLVQVSLVSFLTGYRILWPPFRDLVRRLAPNAILSVDVTQAAGRVELDCLDADCLFASTYKWLLGIHGGCVVVVPKRSADRLTTRAGGWYHLANAFEEDRFRRAEPVPGAGSFAVGMPGFPAIYALNASLEYLAGIGVARIAAHTDPMMAQLHDELANLGIRTMSPPQPDNSSGIVSFQHEHGEAIHSALIEENIHVMHQAGRLRISMHGYNQPADVERLIEVLNSKA